LPLITDCCAACNPTSLPFPLSEPDLLKSYRIMRTIREFEECLHVEFAKGDIPGFVHLYAGEEAHQRHDP
jgi:pyruvate dehydrogenase E1 component alpha subunit